MFVVKTVFFSISYLNMCFGIKNKWFSHFNMSRARERCGVAVEKTVQILLCDLVAVYAFISLTFAGV